MTPTGRPEEARAYVSLAPSWSGWRRTSEPPGGLNRATSVSSTGAPAEAATCSPSGPGRRRATLSRPNASRSVQTIRGEQVLHRAVLHKQLRHCEEPAGVSRAGPGRRPSLVEAAHDLGHQGHDHGVDAQRHPVLGRADVEGVVGRDEDEVVGQEAGRHAYQPGGRPADGHSRHDRDDEDQGGGGHAQVGTEGEHGPAQSNGGWAAEVCGCRIGTIRSRVARARVHLVEQLGEDPSAARDRPR